MHTGPVATAFHGASRATMDIDSVIDPTVGQLDRFVREVEDGARPCAHTALVRSVRATRSLRAVRS